MIFCVDLQIRISVTRIDFIVILTQKYRRFVHQLAIRIKFAVLHRHRLPRQTGQAFDVSGIGPYQRQSRGAEHGDVAAVRAGKIYADTIHDNMIPLFEQSVSNHIPFFQQAAGFGKPRLQNSMPIVFSRRGLSKDHILMDLMFPTANGNVIIRIGLFPEMTIRHHAVGFGNDLFVAGAGE